MIGKAVIKVSLQSVFVITVFSKEHLETLIRLIETYIPAVSGRAQASFESVKKQYHRAPGQEIESGGVRAPLIGAASFRFCLTPGLVQKNPLTLLWDVFLGAMVLYFVLSIIDSAVQEHLASLHEEEVELERKKESGNGTALNNTSATQKDAARVVEPEPESATTTSLRTSSRSVTRNKTRANAQENRSPSPTRRSSRVSQTKKEK